MTVCCAAVLAFGLAACGSNGSDDVSGDDADDADDAGGTRRPGSPRLKRTRRRWWLRPRQRSHESWTAIDVRMGTAQTPDAGLGGKLMLIRTNVDASLYELAIKS